MLRQLTALVVLVGLVSAGGKVKKEHEKKVAHPVYMERGEQTFGCKPGFEAIGTGATMQCVREEFADLEAYCRRGLLRDVGCELVETSLTTCPIGFTRGNGMCMLVETASLLQTCPDGTLMGVEGCVSVRTETPVMLCPMDGAGKHDKKGAFYDCHDLEFVDALLECPPTMTLVGAECVGVVQQPCPVFVSKEKTKVKKVKGGKKYGRVLHEKDSKKLPHAKKAYTAPVVEMCDVEILERPRRLCPVGTLDHLGGCAIKVPVALIPVCHNGILDDISGLCEYDSIDRPLTECPVGFNACTTDGKKGGKKGGYGKKAGYSKKGGYFGADCCRIDYADIIVSCPQGFTLDGRTGECILIEEPDFRCPYGFDRSVDLCIARLIKPPTVTQTFSVTSKATHAVYGKDKISHH